MNRWLRVWTRRHLLAQALGALIHAHIRVKIKGNAQLAAELGDLVGHMPLCPSELQMSEATEIGWSIELLGSRGPLKATCLSQALAARALLDKRAIPSTLTVGLRRREDGTLHAHAWLSVGDHVIVGGRGRQDFTPLGGFR